MYNLNILDCLRAVHKVGHLFRMISLNFVACFVTALIKYILSVGPGSSVRLARLLQL